MADEDHQIPRDATVDSGMTERIQIDPQVCGGRPVIRGTRIAAQTVMEFLAAGDRIEDVLAEYPSLTREDVLACLDYSSRLLGSRVWREESA